MFGTRPDYLKPGPRSKAIALACLAAAFAHGKSDYVVYVDDLAVYESVGGAMKLEHENIVTIYGLEGEVLSGGAVKYYFKDHLGSTRVVMNDAGAVDESVMYFSFGNTKQLQGTTNPAREKFTGKALDQDETAAGVASSNLMYFGARYYDSDVGLWVSPDPARQFHSPYVYSPSPLNSVDPDGNEAVFEGNSLRYLSPTGDQASFVYPAGGAAGPPQRIAWSGESVGGIMGDFAAGKGSGERHITSGPILDVLAKAPHTEAAVKEYLSSGKRNFALSFGVGGFLSASMPPSLERHFLGSYSLSITPAKGGLNLHFRNTTGVESATRGMHPLHPGNRNHSMLKNRPAGSGAFGNISQHYLMQISR